LSRYDAQVSGRLKRAIPDADHDEVRPDLSHLTWVERIFCAGLIYRQWTHNPRRDREMQRYGSQGYVELCSARALGVFVVAVGTIGVALAITGEKAIAVGFFVLAWLTVAAVVWRCSSAGRAGRRWRDSIRSEDTTR
jgi:hypothetical protein